MPGAGNVRIAPRAGPRATRPQCGRLVCLPSPVNSLISLLVKLYAYRHG
jgi:hypothetical protein